MLIATWNINGIKARTEGLKTWLAKARPDIVCLQEIKCQDKHFPAAPFEDLGYNVAVHGQKSFNGVAILSKYPFDEVIKGLPGDDGDIEARYLEAVISSKHGAVRVASLYAPNGNPVDSPSADGTKFAYKLAWLARLEEHARGLLTFEEPFVLAGDYNIIPEPEDVHDPEAWREDALFRPEARRAYRRLLNLGLWDAFRAAHTEGHRYTFWDYQAGAWPKDHGIRIDHLVLSPQAADRLVTADIDKAPRGWERPSDHVPVWIELAL